MKLTELSQQYVTHIPEKNLMVPGVLYVSMRYEVCTHLCACGCGAEIVTPFNVHESTPTRWKLNINDGKVTLYPSIGNYQISCKSHYFIRENKVVWC